MCSYGEGNDINNDNRYDLVCFIGVLFFAAGAFFFVMKERAYKDSERILEQIDESKTMSCTIIYRTTKYGSTLRYARRCENDEVICYEPIDGHREQSVSCTLKEETNETNKSNG